MYHILFIDDEKYINEPFVEYLELSGFKVTFLNSIKEVEIFFLKNQLDDINLIILDIMMPIDLYDTEREIKIGEYGLGYDTGIKIYKKYRNKIVEKNLPVIFYSATSQSFFEEYREDRIVFVKKPCIYDSLISEINSILL